MDNNERNLPEECRKSLEKIDQGRDMIKRKLDLLEEEANKILEGISKRKIAPVHVIQYQIPVGTKVNGIEVIRPQTDVVKYNTTPDDELREGPLKEYAKDKKREEIRQVMSRSVLNDPEEQEIKDMLHLKEKTVEESAEIPGDFDGICRDLMALHAKKNKDYGNAADASYRDFGLISYVIRLNDKLNRLKSLTKPGVEQEVKSESIEDTLMDLAAYAIMAIESLRS